MNLLFIKKQLKTKKEEKKNFIVN